jgi:peptide/nickel transport system substrate-binding protein
MGLKRASLGLLVLVLLLAGCGTQSAQRNERTLVYGLTLEPSGFDPHIHQSSELGIVLRQVYDTLVYRHSVTREIVPGLAEEWQISDDGRVYTFRLRQDVTFHDGTRFDANAVAANLDRIMELGPLSQRARFLLGPYERYELVDSYTIQFVLSSPYSPLLDSLSQVYLGMASPLALSEYSNNRYQFHQVGTGPFRFEKYTPGSEIILERYDDYNWRPEFYEAPVSDSVRRIQYRFFTDPATRAVALETSEVHVMGELLPSSARSLTANSQVRLMPTLIPGIPLQFMMNIQRAPTNSVAFRQALIHATNRGLIADTVFQGFSPVAWGPLSQNTLHYHSGVQGMYAYDLTRARGLLESLGYEDADNDGYISIGEEDLELVMIVPPWGLLPQVAQLVQDQWRDVGIRLTLVSVPGLTALRELVAEGEYHLVAFDSAGLDPSVLNQFYLSDGANNFININSPELDATLLAAVQEMAPGTRRNLYARIQMFIMEQALILPIRDYVNLNASVVSLDGLEYDPFGWFPLMNNVRFGTAGG